jgi:HAD superfamily hydrolase (TIGR01549 family)
MILQAVFFDFDGVIVDSAPIKTAAFGALFRKYGPQVEKKIVDYHLKNQGVSRYDKIRYAYENVLNRPIDMDELAELGLKFSRLVIDDVISAQYLPGVIETLTELQSLAVPAYIVSGTPDEEMKYIAQTKKIDHHFMEIYGSPPGKTEILTSIINRNHYDSSRCLFLGDSKSDYDAANNTSVRFLAIAKDRQCSPFPIGIETYSSIPSIKEHVQSMQ